MKRIIFIIAALILCGTYASAQDKVVLKNGNVLNVKVTKSTATTIEFTYPNETLVNEMKKSEINSILYESGRAEVISNPPQQQESPVVQNNDNDYRTPGKIARRSSFVLRPEFNNGPAFSVGWQVNPAFQISTGFALDLFMPIYSFEDAFVSMLDFREYIPGYNDWAFYSSTKLQLGLSLENFAIVETLGASYKGLDFGAGLGYELGYEAYFISLQIGYNIRIGGK